LAKITQFHEGAHQSRSGTGRPKSQPISRIRRRPMRCAKSPATKLAIALVSPKAIRKESAAVAEATPNSSSARIESTDRSTPTMVPTKALTNTSREN
jgi:hypothetical protein